MSADHGNGVGGLVPPEELRRLRDKMLPATTCPKVAEVMGEDHVLEIRALIAEIERRLEQIESGEKKTERSTTPTCGNTGNALRNLDVLAGDATPLRGDHLPNWPVRLVNCLRDQCSLHHRPATLNGVYSLLNEFKDPASHLLRTPNFGRKTLNTFGSLLDEMKAEKEYGNIVGGTK